MNESWKFDHDKPQDGKVSTQDKQSYWQKSNVCGVYSEYEKTHNGGKRAAHKPASLRHVWVRQGCVCQCLCVCHTIFISSVFTGVCNRLTEVWKTTTFAQSMAKILHIHKRAAQHQVNMWSEWRSDENKHFFFPILPLFLLIIYSNSTKYL